MLSNIFMTFARYAHLKYKQVWYLGQPLKWNHWAGFAMIAMAAWLIFLE